MEFPYCCKPHHTPRFMLLATIGLILFVNRELFVMLKAHLLRS